MSELTAEEERARKLEEAKKKVEELKKKKNKKKNKKKKESSTEATDLTETDEIERSTKTAIDSEDNAAEETGTKDCNRVESDILENENKSGDLELELPEETNTRTEQPGDAEIKATESPMPDTASETKIGETEDSQAEDTTTSTSDGAPEAKTENQPIENAVNDSEMKEGYVEGEDEGEVEELFGEEEQGNDFMTTIQEQKDELEMNKLRDENTSLKDQIKKLKFINMDQEGTIEELEEHISLLKLQVSDKDQKLVSIECELGSAKQEIQNLKGRNELCSSKSVEFSSFDKHSPTQIDQTYSHPATDPAKLTKWKNWNVDMTSWRSIGVGPVVEF